MLCLSMEKLKLGSHEIDTRRKRYRLLYFTEITANGEVTLSLLRPRPLINVVLDCGVLLSFPESVLRCGT